MDASKHQDDPEKSDDPSSVVGQHQKQPDSDFSSDDGFESGSELGKRNRPENGQKNQQQGSFIRKRDYKQSYKAKQDIDKLMIEHEKKKLLIDELNKKREELEAQLSDLQDTIGTRTTSMNQLGGSGSGNFSIVDEMKSQQQQQTQKYHWDYLIKEMKWMAEDFERETKKKVGDSRKHSRACKKQLHEKKLKKEKELKDMKHEVRKRAVNMSKMVQQFWRSVEKVVKHNYNVVYEKKRQALRTKKLEDFVSKHLKLSVKVAEELNTKSFIEQSMHKDNRVEAPLSEDIKIENEEIGVEKVGTYPGEAQKRRKLFVVNVQMNKQSGLYELLHDSSQDTKDEQQVEQINTNTVGNGEVVPISNSQHLLSRALIAEQTVEMAKSFQPTGTTLSSANVKTKVPFLLQGSLREYQIIGLDWLVTLHNKKLNGILADEMGLGKTIQTISMLASLACDKGVWGPHLIVVPTTIIINWEMEFKKWCPAFKILTYFGSQKERKIKRHGWSRENSFHVCITSYKLVIQDHFAFRRKKWYYMILDEAQNIKNFKSQRWQTLLRFNTKRRLLLTGTPLQNDVMELWSLMHFLMPQIFSSQQDFKEWFSNPFNQSINQNQSLNISVVQKLQSILRPFLLRRMKRDVEKQLPEKQEHIVFCNLSRRQRLLYDEYINSDKTKQTLNDSDFFSIMNVLMQLRKVCNHPDLFEARTIESPFIMQERILYNFPSIIYKSILEQNPLKDINFRNLNCVLSEFEALSCQEYQEIQTLIPQRSLVQVIGEKKHHIDHLSDQLMTTRPLADGLALGKRLPINCNVFARSNTKSLKNTTLPQVLPYYESNLQYLEDEVPPYLNTACLPFVQHYYSVENFDQLRFSNKGKPYSEYDTYLSALKDDEQRRFLIKFAQKLIQWRQIDQTNRTNLIFRKPVYGEDCRRSLKIGLIFQDVFDQRRNKNLDRASDLSFLSELESAPSAVFNPFACHVHARGGCNYSPRNFVDDWPFQSQQDIEQDFNRPSLLIKEVPLTLQLSNKKRKQQIKQEMLLLKQQQMIQEEAERKRKEEEEQIIKRQKAEEEERIRKIAEQERFEITQIKSITLVIDLKGLKNQEQLDQQVNPNVEVLIEKHLLQNEDEVMQELDGQVTTELNSGEQQTSPDKDMIEQKEEVKQQIKIEEQQSAIKEEKNKPEEEKQKEEVKIEKIREPRESNQIITYRNCEVLRDLIVTPLQRVSNLEEEIRHFKFIIPKVVSRPVNFTPSKIITKHEKEKAYERFAYQKLMSHRNVHQSLRHSNILFFPHKNLIQYDCGKLQRLATLLKNLHSQGHKVLIFTQMTRILDILEQFLNLHGYTYVRLDGSVKVEMRQRLVDKFNLNKRLFCFISSTRCGGIGINLTGADCVIFYDTDWNPAMDKQAQDRCHRIGQTKTVHIYRLISINTIEENIFKKSLQKRDFGGLIIEGNFDMEIFMKRGVSLKDILEDDSIFKPKRRDLFKEENIMFHTNAHNIGEEIIITQQQPALTDGASVVDFEKQKELESYRKRFEEALVRIEDKEDVIALQQARREIDDEFDEDVIAAQENTAAAAITNQDSTVGGETIAPVIDEVGVDDPSVSMKTSALAAELESRSAGTLQRDMNAHKSDYINWKEHPTLNNVTKLCIEYYENNYSFDAYLEDRSKKDNKFVHPLVDETQEKVEDEEQKSDSEFTLSGDEDEEMSQNGDENQMSTAKTNIWQRATAEELYKKTREEIEHKYFVI